MYKRFGLVVLALLAAAVVVRGASRTYAVTWNADTQQWVLDGVTAPVLTLVPGLIYHFVVPTTDGGKFWISSEDNINLTASALGEADGVPKNFVIADTLVYTPVDSDDGQTFYYLSDTHPDAGAEINIKKCAGITTTVDCEKAAGCGWTTLCVSCSALTSSSSCMDAGTCGWCLSTATETCMADLDNTCSSFLTSDAKDGSLLYLLFLLAIPAVAAIIFVAFMIVKKANYKKRNEAMFHIEDEMSVLGGRPAADDNTL